MTIFKIWYINIQYELHNFHLELCRKHLNAILGTSNKNLILPVIRLLLIWVLFILYLLLKRVKELETKLKRVFAYHDRNIHGY